MSDKPIIDTQDGFGLVRSFTRHVGFVRLALTLVAQEIERRAMVHDLSKMLDDEFAGFSRINAAARVNKFGSEEYKAGMRQERPTIDLHFSRNSHHPEFPTYGDDKGHGLMGSEVVAYDAGVSPREQSFLDVIEMVCDWWGARKGYDDSRTWQESVDLNLKSKGDYLTPNQVWLAKQVADFLGKHPS